VIGGGIFFVPQVAAGLVPHPGILFGVWVLGGLLSLPDDRLFIFLRAGVSCGAD
jgi:hypothetical protein